MSSKTVGILIVIIIVVAGVWLMTRKSGTDYSSTVTPTASSQNGSSASKTPAPSTSQSMESKDFSDAALNQDAAAINAQMNGLNSDTSAAASAQ